ncbi:MAG: methylornithine synthase PylB [Dehalobacterium sp.]
MINSYDLNLEVILDKAYRKEFLSKEEIIFLLSQREDEEVNQIFYTARKIRKKFFDDKIFLYGFVYFSTYCRNNCTFCLYRKANHFLERYRKSKAEILETAASLAESGVHLLDLTMGEDPEFLADDPHGVGKLLKMVEEVKKVSGLPLMISPGVVPVSFLKDSQSAGINWYALYQETHNRDLYGKLRLGQSYDERWQTKTSAHQIGMLVEEGLLTGIGDTMADVADSMAAMRELGAEQVRVMSFVPQKETPMADWVSPSRIHELLIIAVMRLLFPDRLIPASLDVDGIKGLKERLNAGANVVTSIIPPEAGLAGVSNSSLDIEDGNRTVKRVTQVLGEIGLTPAAAAEYQNWVKRRQELLKDPICQVAVL